MSSHPEGTAGDASGRPKTSPTENHGERLPHDRMGSKAGFLTVVCASAGLIRGYTSSFTGATGAVSRTQGSSPAIRDEM